MTRWRNAVQGGVMGVVGFILSPVSFWNDLWVNIPIAYVGAWLASAFYEPAFLPAFVAVYWVTNVAGFILMHKGVEQAVRKNGDERRRHYTRRRLLIDVGIAMAYTLLIVVLIHFDIVRPPDEYFPG